MKTCVIAFILGCFGFFVAKCTYADFQEFSKTFSACTKANGEWDTRNHVCLEKRKQIPLPPSPAG